MTKRTLGQTDLRITPIGIGARAIGGGKWEFAWGHQDDAESIAAIHAGLDRAVAFPRVALLAAILVSIGFFSIYLTTNLFDHLLPGPYTGLFMFLVQLRTFIY